MQKILCKASLLCSQRERRFKLSAHLCWQSPAFALKKLAPSWVFISGDLFDSFDPFFLRAADHLINRGRCLEASRPTRERYATVENLLQRRSTTNDVQMQANHLFSWCRQ